MKYRRGQIWPTDRIRDANDLYEDEWVGIMKNMPLFMKYYKEDEKIREKVHEELREGRLRGWKS
jgi:hypothetical protein